MTITLERLISDPTLYFHSYDGDHARFVEMDRAHFAESVFMDRRIVRPNENIFRVPLDPLLTALEDQPPQPPRLKFIHHVAQCGSTLLARGIDRPANNLVIREPLHLRQLAVQAGAQADLQSGRFEHWRKLLRLSLHMLGKRFTPEQEVIVKGNVPTSMIIGAIGQANPGQPTLLLHFPLNDYLAAVLRTPNHGTWVDSVVAETRLDQDSEIGSTQGFSTQLKAAALWLALVRRFAAELETNSLSVSLDANRMFDEPGRAFAATADLFGSPIPASEIEEVVSGPLFQTYAKDPTRTYDPAQRVERREETMRELAESFAEARSWIEARNALYPLPEAFERPLLGEKSRLL